MGGPGREWPWAGPARLRGGDTPSRMAVLDAHSPRSHLRPHCYARNAPMVTSRTERNQPSQIRDQVPTCLSWHVKRPPPLTKLDERAPLGTRALVPSLRTDRWGPGQHILIGTMQSKAIRCISADEPCGQLLALCVCGAESRTQGGPRCSGPRGSVAGMFLPAAGSRGYCMGRRRRLHSWGLGRASSRSCVDQPPGICHGRVNELLASTGI